MAITISSTSSFVPLQQQQDASPSTAETSRAGGLRGAVPTTSVTQSHAAAQLADIKYLLSEVFDDHRQALIPHNPPGTPATPEQFKRTTEHNSGVEQHNEQIDRLIDSRAAKLLEMGESPADIRAMLNKAGTLDRVATSASSALRSLPFAAATVLQYIKPEINEGKWLPAGLQSLAPLISGAFAGAMDTVGTGVMNQVTGDAHYLKTSPEHLHDALKQSLENNSPSIKQKVLDQSIAIQGYSVRNAARVGLATILEATAPRARGAVDVSVASLGGVAAGVAFGNRLHTTEQRDSIRGAAFLFGRKDTQAKEDMDDETDWLDTYKALKDASFTSVAYNATKRVAGLPVDVLTDGLSAVRGLTTPDAAASNTIAMAGGFAAVGAAQTALTGLVSHPVAKQAVSQTTNTVLSAGVFAGWAAISLVADSVAEKAERFLKNDVKDAPVKLANAGLKVGKAGLDVGTQLGKAGVEAGKAGIEGGARLGARGANYARATGSSLNRRYNELTSRPHQTDVEAPEEARVSNRGNTTDAIPLDDIV